PSPAPPFPPAPIHRDASFHVGFRRATTPEGRHDAGSTDERTPRRARSRPPRTDPPRPGAARGDQPIGAPPEGGVGSARAGRAVRVPIVWRTRHLGPTGAPRVLDDRTG